jgi:secreted trypsin-like serine protease
VQEPHCVHCEEHNESEEHDDFVVVETYTNEPEPFKSRCGRRNSYGLGVRIQNYQDDEAQFGEWPHMCAILRREIISGGEDAGYSQQQQQVEEEVMVFQAGASLIGAGVVLTGAHKVQDFASDPSSLVVRCGEWDTQTEGEPLPHQDRGVRYVELHPEFNKGNLVNTVALLFLETDFELADHIDTICLPDYQETFEDRKECFVKGWGKDTFGQEGEYQVVLKEVALPVVPRDQCITWLRATRLGRRFRLDQSFLCAGGEAGKDACRGDGGGPLVCPQKDDPSHYTQVGIVAWGIGCGEEHVPGVYTNLGEHVCWIDWAMKCQLGDKHVLRYGQECNDWLHKKQAHRFPPIRQIFKACDITWPTIEAEPYSVKTQQTKTTLPEKIRTKTKTQEVTKSAGY